MDPLMQALGATQLPFHKNQEYYSLGGGTVVVVKDTLYKVYLNLGSPDFLGSYDSEQVYSAVTNVANKARDHQLKELALLNDKLDKCARSVVALDQLLKKLEGE